MSNWTAKDRLEKGGVMSSRGFSGLVVVLVVGCLVPGSSFGADSGLDDSLPALGESQTVVRDTPWTIEEIAGNIGAFSHVSVAADGPPGYVYIKTVPRIPQLHYQ